MSLFFPLRYAEAPSGLPTITGSSQVTLDDVAPAPSSGLSPFFFFHAIDGTADGGVQEVSGDSNVTLDAINAGTVQHGLSPFFFYHSVESAPNFVATGGQRFHGDSNVTLDAVTSVISAHQTGVIKVGQEQPATLYVGRRSVSRVYYGSILLFPAGASQGSSSVQLDDFTASGLGVTGGHATSEVTLGSFLQSSTGSSLPAVTSMVVVGDSVAYGDNASIPANSWANKLAAALGASILNKAIEGTVLQNSADSSGFPRSQNMRDIFVSVATGANKRDLLVIAGGYNDMRYTAAPDTMNVINFEADYQEIIDLAFAHGYDSDHIIVVTPYWGEPALYSTGSPGFTGSSDAVNQQYGAATRRIAANNGLWFADTYSAVRDGGGEALVSFDHIHPNDAGHDVDFHAVLGASKVTS